MVRKSTQGYRCSVRTVAEDQLVIRQLFPSFAATTLAHREVSEAKMAASGGAVNYKLQHTMVGHEQSVSSVKFSPDGTRLASAGAICAADSTGIDTLTISLTLGDVM